jgi:acetolactate synthase regulatory subunit
VLEQLKTKMAQIEMLVAESRSLMTLEQKLEKSKSVGILSLKNLECDKGYPSRVCSGR